MADVHWTNETRTLRELIPWPRNPRQIQRDQAQRLAESLQEFGQVDVIAIGPDGEIYNGHQRLYVWAEKYGPDLEVDVRVCSRPLTEKEREKLVIFLHRGTTGEWDFETLANEFNLQELLAWGFEPRDLDLDLWGGGGDGKDPGAQMDLADELQEKWQVQPGQIWQIGPYHRLMCGDATDPDDVTRLMDRSLAGLIWTDPPYGVNLGDVKPGNPQGYRVRQITGDNLPANELEELIRTALAHAATHSIPGAAIYVACPPGDRIPTLIAAFTGSGFVFHWGLVWVKDRLVLGRGDYHFRHENILYGWKHDAAHYFTKSRKQDSVFEVERPRISDEHPTMKPPPLIVQMIENSSVPGWVVYDPFSGSGSTIVACEQTGRVGYAMEIEPKFCAVTLERVVGMGLEVRSID